MRGRVLITASLVCNLRMMSLKNVSLMVVSKKDAASMNLGNALRTEIEGWEEIEREIYAHRRGNCVMWVREESLLEVNHVDEEFVDKIQGATVRGKRA